MIAAIETSFIERHPVAFLVWSYSQFIRKAINPNHRTKGKGKAS